MPNRVITKKQIALLHVAKAQLGLSEETYREMLASVGVLSSVQLDRKQFDELMRRLEAGGFRTTSTREYQRKKGPAKRQYTPTPERARLLGKVGALLADMKLPDGYADGIARQMWGVDRVEWCRPDQLKGVIAALVRRQKRVRSEGSGVRSGEVAEGDSSRLTPIPSRERSDHAL